MPARRPARVIRTIIVFSLLLGSAAPLLAQDPETIGWLVIDARGSLVPFKRDEDLAISRGFDPQDTPGLGIGIDVGAHLYFFRWKVITFGIGASMHLSRADQKPPQPEVEPPAGAEAGPTLRRTFAAVAPQLSLNFGGPQGWSYISGGLAPSRLSLHALDGETPLQRRISTLNYGGGARWFTNDHIAFSLDLRFYASKPLPATDTEPPSPRLTTMVLSIGASFK